MLHSIIRTLPRSEAHNAFVYRSGHIPRAYVQPLASSIERHHKYVSKSWRPGVCHYMYRKCDNDNLKLRKYVCITTYKPDTKSIPNHNPSPTLLNCARNSEHQLNTVACRYTYPEKFMYETCCCTVSATLGCNCHIAVSERPMGQVYRRAAVGNSLQQFVW